MAKLVSFIFMALAVSACASGNNTDSDKLINEFHKAGQRVGEGIEKGVNNVRKGVCNSFNESTNKCED